MNIYGLEVTSIIVIILVIGVILLLISILSNNIRLRLLAAGCWLIIIGLAVLAITSPFFLCVTPLWLAPIFWGVYLCYNAIFGEEAVNIFW